MFHASNIFDISEVRYSVEFAIFNKVRFMLPNTGHLKLKIDNAEFCKGGVLNGYGHVEISPKSA